MLEVRRDGAAAALEQYIWSLRYIDAPVLRDRDADGNAGTGGLGAAASGMEQRVYYLTDGNVNPNGAPSGVTALAGTDGAILERYAYDAYGKARVYDPNWAARQSGSYGNAILFCGYFRDAETGMYHVRHRYYHPQLGRWMSRDFLEYIDGMGLYEYCRGMPTFAWDPFGLHRLKYDGGYVYFYDDLGNLIGQYPATSGKPGEHDWTKQDKGPIPPGHYTLDPSRIEEHGLWRRFKNWLKGADWGKYRVPLSPVDPNQVGTRDDFYLHGGDRPGSAGCIDVGGNDSELFPQLQKHCGPIDMGVGYPKGPIMSPSVTTDY